MERGDAKDNDSGWIEGQTELEPGVHEIWSGAIGHLDRSPPLDGPVYGKPNGYEVEGCVQDGGDRGLTRKEGHLSQDVGRPAGWVGAHTC